MVEGHRRLALPCTDLHRAFLAHFGYSRHRTLQICHDGRCRYTQRCDMLRLQKARPSSIVSHGMLAVMCQSVDLDSKAHRRAIEIENIDACRMLAPEFETFRSLPQDTPKHPFGEAHFAAQFACTFQCVAGAGNHGMCPSTILRMVPLPVPGRITSICRCMITS
ncbi:hypothetical protein ATE67_05430 [Sphingopyxis sp. H050]|nr:hypothetical protein ATE67_05430 [Sphingopyxis sp. H050]